MKQKKRNSFAVLGYTKNMMVPMAVFTAAANAIFAVLIIAHRMRMVDGVDNEGRQGSRNGYPGGAEKVRRNLQAHGGYAAQFRAVEIPVMEEEYE